MSDNSIVQEIKDKLDIVQVFERYGYSLKKEGSEHKGSISATSKSGKSLHVNPDKQVYNDFAGHAGGGDVLDAISYCEGLDIRSDFPLVLKIAADMAGIELHDGGIDYDIAAEKRELLRLYRVVFEHYHGCLTDEIRELILTKWGIINQTVDDLLIGWAPDNSHLLQVPEIKDQFSTEILKKSGLFYYNDNGKLVDIYRDRLVFSYWKNGEIVYSIGRSLKYDNDSSQKKFIKQLIKSEKRNYVSEAVKNVLFGEDTIRGQDTVYITEGIADAITLMQAGLPVLSPVTVQFKKSDIEQLVSCCRGKKLVKIINDNETNNSGLEGAISTAKALEKERIRAYIITLPREEGRDKIDVAEFMLTHSREELEGLQGEDVWTKLLSQVPIPDTPRDSVRALKDFIYEHLVDMDPVERVVFCRGSCKSHFNLTNDVINTILKGITFKTGNSRFFAGDGSFIPLKLSEEIQKEDRYITTAQGIWIYHADTGCYQMDGEERIRRKTRDALGIHSNERYGNEVVYDIETCTRVDLSVFDGNTQCVNLQNGYVDVYTGEFSEHSPDVYFTYALPFEYDPAAECNHTKEFLDVAGIDHTEAFEMFAYALVPGYPIHSIDIFSGDGGNGKGTLFRLFKAYLGAANITAYTMQELAKDPYAKAGLYGKLANICGDMPGNRVEDTAIIKSLSGEDEITARNIYGRPFSFTNRAKLMFSMNHMPELDDNTDSTFRRLVIHEFNNLVDGVTEGFSEDNLTAELSGIFNEAMRVLPELLKRGKFSAWRGIEETRQMVQLKSDNVAAFIDKCVDIGDGETPTQDAYTAYTQFCIEKNETRETNIVFGRKIRKLHPDIGKGRRGTDRVSCYIGMTLKEPYATLTAADVDKKYSLQHDKKHSLFSENEPDKSTAKEEPSIDETKSSIDPPQIKNPINQQQETELPKSSIDNPSIFNNNLEDNTDKEDHSSYNIANNVESSMEESQNKALAVESGKNHLWRICGVAELDNDSICGLESGRPVRTVERSGDLEMTEKIENLLNKWEKHNSKIFAGNKVRAQFDIPKYNDARGIDHKLIFEAVEKRSKGRCLDCGVDTGLNEEKDISGGCKGHRCKPCHDIYSNPPPVVIPEEINLEPKEVSPCTHPAHTCVIDVRKTDWASEKDLPADCVYIGREEHRWKKKDEVQYNFKKSKWHNEYREDDLKNGKKRDGTREEVIEKYRIDLFKNDELLESLHEFYGKGAVCWHPGPCHGHVILEFRDASYSGYSVIGRYPTANEVRSIYSAILEAGRELSSDEIMEIFTRSDVRMPAENNPEPVEVVP